MVPHAPPSLIPSFGSKRTSSTSQDEVCKVLNSLPATPSKGQHQPLSGISLVRLLFSLRCISASRSVPNLAMASTNQQAKLHYYVSFLPYSPLLLQGFS